MSEADRDRQAMDLALREARKGRPSPNPHVGAVIVRDGETIAVGHHERAGLAHAEVAAIQAAGERARGATLYVTFEPCNHVGRTGPCTDAIIAAGIARVVVGCEDPAPHVPGATQKLREAGITVELGVRRRAARALIADFAKHITTGIPQVTLKAAVTLDGRLATRTGDSKWITGERARAEAHRLRDRSDAVLVGVNTVLADDPELTVRHVQGVDPIRVVLDAELRTPPSAKVVRHGSAAPTLIFHADDAEPARAASLAGAGVEVIAVPRGPGGVDLGAVLRELGRRDVVRLLVEGGSTVHGSLLDAGLADRAAVFVAPLILGDREARPLAAGVGAPEIARAWRLRSPRIRKLGPDVLFEGELHRPRARGKTTAKEA